MTATAELPGPDGVTVKCYRRGARNVVAGDYLPEHGATALGDGLIDPERGTVWIALDTGDVELTRRAKVWVYRTYDAPPWLADALDAYRHAVYAREAVRESGGIVPAGLVPGSAGASIAWHQLEDDDFRRAYPHPRLSEYVKQAAMAYRAGRDAAELVESVA